MIPIPLVIIKKLLFILCNYQRFAPGELHFVKVHMGWDFDIHNDPQGGKIDSTAILKSWEDLGMSDKWCAILEHTQNSFE